MKKHAMIVFLALSFLGVSGQSHAYYDEYKANILDGFGTMVQSPKPLLVTVKDEFNAAEFKPFGILGGTLKGGAYMIKEFSLGVFQVLTFNVGEDNFFANLFK